MMTNMITLNNGITMPMIGIGGWAQKKEHILMALDDGYRLIDTAAQYGNEEEIGKAILQSGVRREEIFLSTKLWTDDIRRGRTRTAFEESIDRLKTDYIDLYLIHWPAEGFEDAWLEMEDMYREGKIRAIGVSNFEPHHIEALEEHGARVVPAVNQIEIHPYFSNVEVVKYGQARGIHMEAWCPLGGPDSGELQDEKIINIAERYGKTPAQIILRWHLQKKIITIPKSSNADRMMSNLDIFDFELDEKEVSEIDDLNIGKRLGAHPDHFNF